jgi:hypothetical protein
MLKIKRYTPTLFIAQHVPWVIAGALFFFIMAFVTPGLLLAFDGVWHGVLFAAAGGGLGFAAMCVFVERLMLRLDAQDGTATVRRLTILKRTSTTIPLDEVIEAATESIRDQETGRRQSRPVLRLKNGESLPITRIYSSGSGADRLVEKVNGWLEDRKLYFSDKG